MLALPFDIGEEGEERIRANIPDGIYTVFINEGSYPAAFRPDNGAIVCTGLALGGYRQYILPSCCRMMSLYKAFRGERLLLSCLPRKAGAPEIGWTYSETDFFTRIVEGGEGGSI